jgi:hypothetical protein
MLVLESRTSSANGAFGRHERQDNAGMRPVTAASGCRSSARRSIALIVLQAGQRTYRNQYRAAMAAPIVGEKINASHVTGGPRQGSIRFAG